MPNTRRKREKGNGRNQKRRASKSKSRFAATSQPDPRNSELEERVFAAAKRQDIAERRLRDARGRGRAIARAEAWLRSRGDCVLIAAVLLIVLWELVPGSKLSAAVIIALLALAGTAFKSVAPIGVASACDKPQD